MTSKIYFTCPVCHRKYSVKEALYDHMASAHKEDMAGLPAAQVYFNWKNRKEFGNKYGRSIMSGKPTPFNMATERYEKFANEDERQQFRQMFEKRMMAKYGKTSLMDDPDHVKDLLAARSISGTYVWKDGTKMTYTGNYEKAFLEHLEATYDWDNVSDIMAPCPVVFHYTLDGKDHFHIPDFEIGSVNLIVNIKSASTDGNKFRDLEKENAEDDSIINDSSYNYVKIFDNDFRVFDKVIEYLRNTEEPDRMIYIGSVKK